MIIRHYDSSDEAQVRALHAAQGLAYELPDLKATSMLSRVVVETDGIVEMASFLRKTTEAYLLFDPLRGSRRYKLGRLLALHYEVNEDAKRNNIEDVHCWLPSEIDCKFGKLLMHLGWTHPLWACYSRKVG